MNLTVGQTIYLRFYGDWDSDYAPDLGIDPVRYVIKAEDYTLVIILSILIPAICATVVVLFYFRKKGKI